MKRGNEENETYCALLGVIFGRHFVCFELITKKGSSKKMAQRSEAFKFSQIIYKLKC